LKGENLMLLPKRTEALHGLFDGHVGLLSAEVIDAEVAAVGVN